jgi:urea transport system ATP-binding protein
VPQGREIFPQLTVQENLILGLEARRGRPGEKQLRKSDRDKVPDIVFDMFQFWAKC